MSNEEFSAWGGMELRILRTPIKSGWVYDYSYLQAHQLSELFETHFYSWYAKTPDDEELCTAMAGVGLDCKT